MPNEIAKTLRSFADDGHIETHYAGCWRYHWRCLMRMAADVIDELSGEQANA